MDSMKLLPATPGTCAMCAVDHEPSFPHDLTSLFYGVRFKMKWKVNPTWADAAAHCKPELVQAWKRELEKLGREWTSPTDRDAIREPYAKNDPFGPADGSAQDAAGRGLE